MFKIRRVVTPIFLVFGLLPLFSFDSQQHCSVQSNDSHRSLPRSQTHRPGQNLLRTARNVRRTAHGRKQVTAKEAQSPTQLPQFFDAPLYPLPGNFGAALTGDFNGDGKPDLLMGANILLGNGDGSFQVPNSQVVASSGYESVATGDFNNDGKLDLAVVAPPNIAIQLGNGDGTFQAPVDYSLGGLWSRNTEVIAVSDFNGDGKLDLAVVYSSQPDPPNGSISPSASILLGNGDGTFQPHQDFPVESANSIAVGDFNGDGKSDVAVVAGDSVDVLLGKGDGSLQPYVAYPVTNPGNIAVASLRGTGHVDLVITCSDVTVRVLLGNGDGTFQPQAAYGTLGAYGFYYGAPVVGDFNGDGVIDVAFVNDAKNQAGVLLGNGDGTFGAELLFGTGPQPTSLTAGDFNGDGKLDLATENFESSAGILLGNGDGTFLTRPDYAIQGAATGVAIGDFNGDGNPDMAVAVLCDYAPDCTSRTVDIFLGNPDGTFRAPVTYAVQDIVENGFLVGASSVVAADLNHDGKLDLVVGNFQAIGWTDNTLGISVLLGNGDGTFQMHTDYPGASMVQNLGSPSEGASVAIADLNGDGNLDVVATGPQLGAVVWLGNGDGTFRASTRYSNTGSDSSALAVGDFNGDGIPDLAVTNGSQTIACTGGYECNPGWVYQGTTVSVLLGRGDGSFGPPLAYQTASDPESVAVGDFNKDGKLDLVVVGGVGPASILLGNGDGTFQKAMEFPIEEISPDGIAVPIAVAVGDFNLDGRQDVVVGSGYGDAVIGLLLGNGDGTFQPFTTCGTGTEPYMIAVGDSNHDGKPDLATANRISGTVSILRNIQGPDFSVQATAVSQITQGQSASSTVTINSILGFSNSVSLSCAVSLTSGTGTAPMCSLSPATVQLSANGSGTSTLTISTSGLAAAFKAAPFGQDERTRYALWFSISGMALAMVWTTHIRKNKLAVPFGGTLLAGLLVLSACGGNSGGGTSGGGGGGGGGSPQDATYSVTVTATSGSLVRMTTLTVTVQ